LKFYKKPNFKNKLRLLGGVKKKKVELKLTENDENISQNLEKNNEIKSNRIDSIINSQANQKTPEEDMLETIESKREEKRLEKKKLVLLNKIKYNQDQLSTITFDQKNDIVQNIYKKQIKKRNKDEKDFV